MKKRTSSIHIVKACHSREACSQSSQSGGGKSVILYVLPILLFLSVSYAIAAIPVDVTIGKETVLTLKNASHRISLADPEIANVKLISPTEIVINGKKPGVTSLIVWDKEGNRNFYDIRALADMKTLEQLIKGVAPSEDIRVEYAKDTIVLSGFASNQNVIDNVVKVASIYAEKGDQVTTRTYAAGVTDERIVTTFKLVNYLRVKEAQQVILEVRVAQIDKQKFKDLGIAYLFKEKTWELAAPGLLAVPSGTVGGGTGGTPGTTGAAVVGPGIGGFDVGSIAPQIAAAYFPGGVAGVLKALAEKDYAKVLAEPNLVVRSGETGEFFAGTRVPVQEVLNVTAGGATPSITFENVGIRLVFKPEVLETGVIRLRIDPAEVANITRFLTLSGIIAPEIDTRRVSTSVDLNDGESLILAGLLSDETKKSIQKIPVLGDIPILGALFRNTHDEVIQKELAFFITPRLVKPIPAGVKTTLPEERQISPQEEKEFNWIPLPSSSDQTPEERSGSRLGSVTPGNGNLKEEVNLFMDRYVRAYEFGDASRFMSLYSKSAVENGMGYDDIRRSYQRIFEKDRYAYTLSNPQVQKNGDLVVLTGSFGIKKAGEGWPVSQGNIRWTLAREDGVLKIVKVEY